MIASAIPNTELRNSIGALLLSALIIGLVPIFMRLGDVGPISMAFWRLAIASLLMFVMFRNNLVEQIMNAASLRFTALAGLFFAVDLVFFHISIQRTDIANASFLNNLAPVFVGSLLVISGRRPDIKFWFGLSMALIGLVSMFSSSWNAPHANLVGNFSGVLSAIFFALYLMTIEKARESLPTWPVLWLSSTVGCVVLLPIAFLFGESVLPSSLAGWSVVLAMAALCHVCGQALLVYALARLSSAQSSMGMLLQPVAATVFAVIIFYEVPNAFQYLGAVAILVGIAYSLRFGKES